jgi:hypothetical protein
MIAPFDEPSIPKRFNVLYYHALFWFCSILAFHLADQIAFSHIISTTSTPSTRRNLSLSAHYLNPSAFNQEEATPHLPPPHYPAPANTH